MKTTRSQTRPPCPHCQKGRVHRNGTNKLATGYILQRWYCQDCDRGFTPKQPTTIRDDQTKK